MGPSEIRKLAGDPWAFLGSVKVETDAGPAVWNTIAHEWQRRDVAAILPALAALVDSKAAAPVVRRCWWERPRSGSKTSDFALLLAWLLAFSPRKRRATWCAADAEQGNEGRTVLEGLVRANPWLASFLRVRADRVENLRTGGECIFTTSDVGSAFGRVAVDVTVLDELVHWRDQRLWEAMFSTAGKRADSVLAVLTNSGFAESWQSERRGAAEHDPAWAFSAWPGPAPWIPAARLAEQERHLPRAAFARLWENTWVSGSGGDAFLDSEIDGCLTLAGPARGREPGWSYVAGVDLAVRRDAAVACVVGIHRGYTERIDQGEPKPVSRLQRILQDVGPIFAPEPGDAWPPFAPAPGPSPQYREHAGSGRLKLCECKVWKPTGARKVSLEEVKAWILAAHERFGFREVAFDPSQAELAAEQLRAAGVPCKMVDQTGWHLQEQGATVLDAIRERRLDLYAHPDLVSDLRAARIQERSYGWRLYFARSGRADGPGCPHGDSVSALSLAVAAARRHRRPPGPPRVGRDLVCD